MNRIYYSAWNKIRTFSHVKTTANYLYNSSGSYCSASTSSSALLSSIRSTPKQNNSSILFTRFNSSSSTSVPHENDVSTSSVNSKNNNNEQQEQEDLNEASSSSTHHQNLSSESSLPPPPPPPPPQARQRDFQARQRNNAPSSSYYQEEEEENFDDGFNDQYPPRPLKKAAPGELEDIRDRLYRLSASDPEDFVPTENAGQKVMDRYKNSQIPEQRPRSNFSNRGGFGGFGGRSGYGGINYQDEDDYNSPRQRYGNNDGGYGNNNNNNRGGYGGENRYNRNNEAFSNQRGFSRDPYSNNSRYENDRYNNQRGGGGSRYQARRYQDDDEDEENFFEPPKNIRGGGGGGGRPARRPADPEVDEDFDEIPSSRDRQKQMQKDYDLDDFDFVGDDEPRQSSGLRFSNTENRQAIKDAYIKRFPSVNQTTKREYHSFASGRTQPSSSSFMPDLNIPDDSIMNKTNNNSNNYNNNNLSTYSKKNQNKKFTKSNIHQDTVSTTTTTSSSEDSPKKFWRNIRNKDNQHESIQDTFSEVGDDPDVFGTVIKKSASAPAIAQLEGERLFEEEEYEEEVGNTVFQPEKRMTIQRLTREVIELLDQKKLPDAVLHFTTTIKEGGFNYDLSDLSYLYRVLINECAKVGYVKMAYSLYIKMRKSRIIVKDSVYTSIFNACANSPWDAEENLKRLRNVRSSMTTKGYVPNPMNYHALIKAYGRNNNVDEAFAVVDEMISCDRRLRPKTETFNFLLQACISDKENGFRHALFTWDKMKSMEMSPDIYSYNLLLRATRECSVILPPAIQKHVTKRLNRASKDASEPIPLPFVVETQALVQDHVLNFKESLELVDYSRSQGPDYVIPQIPDQIIDAIICFSQPTYRLAVLGGLRGILRNMKHDRVRPDLKTATELVQCAASTEVTDALTILTKLGIKPDVNFLNVMIKKLNQSHTIMSTSQLLNYFNEYRLSPDIYTWSALALGCKHWTDAKQLMLDMEQLNFRPNQQVFGSFMSQAVYNVDPVYIMHLMTNMKRHEVKPTPLIVGYLEKLKTSVTKSIVQYEKGEEVTALPRLNSVLYGDKKDKFLSDWRFFKLQHNEWILNTKIHLEPNDPWEASYKEYRQKINPKKIEEIKKNDIEV